MACPNGEAMTCARSYKTFQHPLTYCPNTNLNNFMSNINFNDFSLLRRTHEHERRNVQHIDELSYNFQNLNYRTEFLNYKNQTPIRYYPDLRNTPPINPHSPSINPMNPMNKFYCPYK